MQEPTNHPEALANLHKHLTHRAKRLATLERYVEGSQYEGLPDWFSGDCPLWERAPCIVDLVVKNAITSNGDLLLGEGRFPAFRFEGLSGDEANSAEKAIEQIIKQARLKAASRETFEAGQGCGSACVIFGVRSKRFFIDTVRAGWCTPTLDAEGAVVALEIQYPYLAVEPAKDGDSPGKWVCKVFRRTIDKTHDIQFHPVKVNPDGTLPAFTVDVEVAHGFSFCPVIWFPHLQGCAITNDFDGRAIHERLTDEIRGHDFALSQRHRAALYAGDPQWTEIGVEPGYNPTSPGRQAEMRASLTGRPGEAATGSWVSEKPSHGGKARKKSPGDVWQYGGKNPEVQVKLHTLPGDALQALDAHAKDLRTKLTEGLGVVFLDMESMPNESRISGRAFEALKARQLARVDYYRSDFGDKFLLPALGMLIRIAIETGMKFEGLDIIKSQITAAAEAWSWHAPPIDLVWGPYSLPAGEEEELLMRGAKEALEAGFATKRVIVEKLRHVLGIKDVDAYMAELEAEQAEVQEQQLQTVAAEAKAVAAANPKPAPAAKPKAKAK